MSVIHTVVQGETLAQIAHAYGFADYRTVRDHPDNAAFRQRRPDPNVLCPQDRVVIPDRVDRIVTCATGQPHRFVVRKPRATLKLVLTTRRSGTGADEPLAGRWYRLEVAGEQRDAQVPQNGVIQHAIPLDAREAQLTIWTRGTPGDAGTVFRLRIGALDPHDELTGVQARLQNLGLYEGPVNGRSSGALEQAIFAFQRKHGLECTGTPDDTLRDRLRAEHGT